MAEKIKTATEYIDHGWDEIVRNLREVGNSYTKVGLPNDGKTKGRHDMATLIEVGFANEFGYDEKNIPERPFMRNTFDENKENIVRMQKEACERVIDGVQTPRMALFEIGEEVVEMTKQKIIHGPFTKNSDVTIAKKGYDHPLNETGQLLNSIQHKEVFVR